LQNLFGVVSSAEIVIQKYLVNSSSKPATPCKGARSGLEPGQSNVKSCHLPRSIESDKPRKIDSPQERKRNGEIRALNLGALPRKPNSLLLITFHGCSLLCFFDVNFQNYKFSERKKHQDMAPAKDMS
jgi:hypothetical protein